MVVPNAWSGARSSYSKCTVELGGADGSPAKQNFITSSRTVFSPDAESRSDEDKSAIIKFLKF
jgi:hypothetical protein